MESMNKFKVLTVVVICLFLFVIGAIYSNTKDAAIDKQKEKGQEVKTEIQTNLNNENTNINENKQTIEDLTNQITMLNTRVDELNEKVDNASSDFSASTSGKLNCKIVGMVGDNGIEKLSPEAAVQEAEVNNREIVVTCRF